MSFAAMSKSHLFISWYSSMLLFSNLDDKIEVTTMISPDMMTLDTTVSTETPMIDDEEIPTTMMTILDDSDDKDNTLDGTIDDTLDDKEDTLDDKDDTFDDTMDTTMEPESSMLPKEMIDVTTMSTTSTTTTTTETIEQVPSIDDDKDNEIDP